MFVEVDVRRTFQECAINMQLDLVTAKQNFKVHMKTPVLGSLFNNVAGLKQMQAYSNCKQLLME